METTILGLGFRVGIMENQMEGYIGIILGLYRDNGKENGNYYNGLYRGYMGVYRDNGKENGNYYSILGVYMGIMENQMETTIVGVISTNW